MEARNRLEKKTFYSTSMLNSFHYHKEEKRDECGGGVGGVSTAWIKNKWPESFLVTG